jgi:hypothetical protein
MLIDVNQVRERWDRELERDGGAHALARKFNLEESLEAGELVSSKYDDLPQSVREALLYRYGLRVLPISLRLVLGGIIGCAVRTFLFR